MKCLLPLIQRVFYFMEQKKSGIKGITWNRHRNKWVVRTTINGQPIQGKSWDNLTDAKKELKQINPKAFSKKKTGIDFFRKKEVQEAKEYLKRERIRDLKYLTEKDIFELEVERTGFAPFYGRYYSFDEAIEKYYQWKDAQNYWYNKEKRRRGIKWFNEEWIAFIYVKGKYQEVGKFKHYLDALEAVAEAERDNPDCDLI